MEEPTAMDMENSSTLENDLFNGIETVEIPRIDDLQRVITGVCYLIASILGISGSVVVTLSPVTVEYPIPDWLCAAASAVVSTTFGCSVYTLASIAINRLDGVTRPTKRYNVNYTFWMGLWVFIVWLIPFLATVLPPLLDIGTLGTNSYLRTCSVKAYHPRQELQGQIQVLAFYPIPLPVICICYVTIFIYIRRHTKLMVKTVAGGESAQAIALATSMRKREVTVAKNMFYVVAIFILFLSPYGIWVFLGLHFESAILYVSTLVVFNSCVNPLLYGLKHPTFKEIFKYILLCRWQHVPEPSEGFKRLLSVTDSNS
ncbi:opsin, blue-sensitive-like [Amphiura filiformis]|uniref:opsin, blue-sensitive-like n=1 Tax=Amphiura filiformis TaxID=82378 RepID=UPI003B22017C